MYNEEETVAQCLESLVNQTYPKKEIIVVDDGSTDKSWEIICRSAKQNSIIKTIRTNHRGCAHARNVGIEAAKGDIIALTEADAIYDTDWLKHSLTQIADPNVAGVLGPRYALHPNTWVSRCAGVWWKIRFSSEYKPFGAYVFKKSVIDEAGGLDPQLPDAEDRDLGIRITRLGYRFAYEPKAVFWHKEPSTVKEVVRKAFNNGKNHLKFFVKYPNNFPYGRLGLSALFLTISFMALFNILYLQLLCLVTICIFTAYSLRMLKKGWRAAFKRRYLLPLSLLGLLRHAFFIIGLVYGSLNYLSRSMRSKSG